jgi:hypothetical protein
VDRSAIEQAIRAGSWAMTRHARERAGKRRITAESVVTALTGAEVLEQYPGDPRGESALVLGHVSDGRPLHVVCAFDPVGTLLIITVYEPDPGEWLNERTRK